MYMGFMDLDMIGLVGKHYAGTDVGGKSLNINNSAYVNILDCVRVKWGEMKCFRIDWGVDKECIMSPWLFMYIWM